MSAEIQEAIKQIEAAAGEYVASGENPCGLCAYYDEGEPKPWRIADDGNSSRFATLAEAIAEAKEWADAMRDA
jgi:hypothetical protein